MTLSEYGSFKPMQIQNFHAGDGALPDTSIADILRWRARHQGHGHALTFLLDGERQEQRWTYADLDRRAQAIQAALAAELMPGERVLLIYPPGLEYVAAFFGCLYAGVVAVPMYPPRNNRSLGRLQAIVANAEATVVLTTGALSSALATHSAALPGLSGLRWIATDELADAPATPRLIHPADLAFIQYTSGSTSEPKGVMLSHANLLHNLRQIKEAFGHTAEHCGVIWLPPYHDMGLIGGILQPLFAGFPVILMAPTSFLQRPMRWLEAIARYGGTTSGGPNFAYDLCVQRSTPEQRRKLDLSTWQVAFNGAEPVRSATLRHFAELFEPCGFQPSALFPCYGLAEATLLVAAPTAGAGPVVGAFDIAALRRLRVQTATPEADGAEMLVSTGQPRLTVLIIDPETRRPCASDEIGEIWVAGDSVASGYWDQAVLTDATFAAHTGDGSGPYLRTGDLGFLLRGELFVTGRIKDLIIVRGRNFYPHDLEHTAGASHPALLAGGGAAFSVDVDGHEQVALVHELERQSRRGDHTAMAQAIRQAVAEQFELQIHTIIFLAPGGLPKTSSGKVQRQLCRRQFLDGTLPVLAVQRLGGKSGRLETPAVANPVTDLRDEIGQLLQVPAVLLDLDLPLTAQGLDSLSAMEITHLLERTWAFKLDATALLDGLSLREINAQLAGRAPVSQPTSQQRGGAASAPATYGQQALWFLQQLAPESTAYHIARAFRVRGVLKPEALERSIALLVERHPILRASFSLREEQLWLEARSEPGTPLLRIVDGRRWDAAECQAQVQALANQPFDLTAPPLFRIYLVERAAAEAVLVLVFHHSIVDLWSLMILLEELRMGYAAISAGQTPQLSPPPASAFDLAAGQADSLAGARGAELAAFWQHQLVPPLPVLELSTDHPRTMAPAFPGARHRFALTATITRQLKHLAQQEGATLYTVLLTLYAALLNRLACQDEVLIGTPVAGRMHAEGANTVGYLVNSVVIRTPFDAEQPFSEAVAAMRSRVLNALRHQDYPFALIVEQTLAQRDPGRTPVFQTMFTLERPQGHATDWVGAIVEVEAAGTAMADLALIPYPLAPQSAQHDLTLTMVEIEGALHGVFEYRTDLFDAATIDRYTVAFATLTKSALDAPGAPIGRLAVVSTEQWQQWGREWNATAQPYPATTIDALFAAQAWMTPAVPAVVDQDRSLTYAELHTQARHLAGYLRDQGVSAESMVGVYLEPGVNIAVGVMAILIAGATYVPLDPAYPDERLRLMLENTGIRFVVTDMMLCGQLPPTAATVVILDQPEVQTARSRLWDAATVIAPEQLAYVLFTSGSTGQPKGVGCSHRNVINLILPLNKAYPSPVGRRWSSMSSLSFDVSVYELFSALLGGGTLHIAPTSLRGDIAAGLAWLEAQQIHHAYIPPFMVEPLCIAAEARPGTLMLQRVLVGVEPLREQLLARLCAALPGLNVINGYGPTEATVCSLMYKFETPWSSDRPAPVGTPLANTTVYLLDGGHSPTPMGGIGEIYIGGDGLARGYVDRPALTAERFTPNPFGPPGARLYRTGDLARLTPDGLILFVGRNDQQVKVNGVRIEPGEIEGVISRHPAVAETAVVAHSDADGRRQLIAYAAPHPGQTLDGADLRHFVQERVPMVMVPQAFVILDALPRSENGKIERRALPLPQPGQDASPPYAAPRTPLEATIAAFWQEVLGIPDVSISIYDNFFALGGHSLILTQLRARLQQHLSMAIPLPLLLRATTVAEQAQSLELLLWAAETPPATESRAETEETFTI